MDAQGVEGRIRSTFRLSMGKNEICLAHPFFILGLMLIFPSFFPSLSVIGKTLSDQVVSYSLVPKSELYAL